MSARFLSARWRSASNSTRSRSADRLSASSSRGAAYDACSDRIRVSSVKFRLRGSNCMSSGAMEFQASHAAQMSVIHTRNIGVPM